MALTPVDGIRSAEVELGAATVEHDRAVTIDALRDAIAVSGYVVLGGSEERSSLPVMDSASDYSDYRVR